MSTTDEEAPDFARDEDEKLVQARAPYRPPSRERPREWSRGEHARRLERMGYDTNEEAAGDLEP